MAKKASATKTAPATKAKLSPLAAPYNALGQKLNKLFAAYSKNSFAEFKKAVGNDPANYVFGQVVTQLSDPDEGGKKIDPGQFKAGKWASDVLEIAEHDRKLLQIAIAGNIFSHKPMQFLFSVARDAADPRVEVRAVAKGKSQVLAISIYCKR